MIAEVDNGNPPSYLIRWNEKTLASIHPIYRKRCERDGLDVEEMWLSEEVLLGAGLKVSVLRLAAVYGRRMKGNYRRLVDALRRHRFVAVGQGSNRRTLVHERDVTRAAILAADRVNEVNGVFNVTDGRTHAMREILAAICSALGRPEPRLRIPESLARTAARGLGQSHLIDKYLETVEVKGEHIQKALGFSPEFDLTAGWRDAIQPWERG